MTLDGRDYTRVGSADSPFYCSFERTIPRFSAIVIGPCAQVRRTNGVL
jgi:hypothetical protein